MNKKQSNLEYVKGVYGKNYANLRKKEYNSKKDYTVRELADKLFISASTISAIEKETRLPTVDQVLIYKKFFGVSLDYLTGDTEILKCDMQMVCDYTGLSEKSIKLLNTAYRYSKQEYNKHEISPIMVLDDLIKYLDYHSLIISSMEYLLKLDLSKDTEELLKNFSSLYPEANKWLYNKGVVISNEKELYNMITSISDKISDLLLDIAYNENQKFTKKDDYIEAITNNYHKSSYIDSLLDLL